MLVDKFQNNLGKSSDGGETLYDHTMDCVKVMHKVLTDQRFGSNDYPTQKRDQLLYSMFIHDIGKLDPDFQAMLEASRNGTELPAKRVKHEASTLDFQILLMETQEEVKEHLGDVLDYEITTAIDFEDALAFAVSHHGLFYLSFEMRDGEGEVKRIRREWTTFNHNEQRRITLVDLLFDYHPFGGLVIISDLLGSFCYEQQISDADQIIGDSRSLRHLMETLLQEGIVETVERSINEYDPRNYGLQNLITLLAGGLAS